MLDRNRQQSDDVLARPFPARAGAGIRHRSGFDAYLIERAASALSPDRAVPAASLLPMSRIPQLSARRENLGIGCQTLEPVGDENHGAVGTSGWAKCFDIIAWGWMETAPKTLLQDGSTSTKETEASPGRSIRPPERRVSPYRNRMLLAISASSAMAMLGIGMVVPVRVLYAQSHGASLAIIGAMASAFLLSSVVFQYPVGWLADLWGKRRVMNIGLIGLSILTLCWLIVTDPVLFVVLRFVEGIFAAGIFSSARALLADEIPDEQRGQAFGIYGACLNGGFLLGPALGGLLASYGIHPHLRRLRGVSAGGPGPGGHLHSA